MELSSSSSLAKKNEDYDKKNIYHVILPCNDVKSDGWGARKAGGDDPLDVSECWSSLIDRQSECVLRLTSIQYPSIRIATSFASDSEVKLSVNV